MEQSQLKNRSRTSSPLSQPVATSEAELEALPGNEFPSVQAAGDVSPAARLATRPAAGRTTITAEARHQMIAEAAYDRAEQGGFQGNDPEQDWLESEREVDAGLMRV